MGNGFYKAVCDIISRYGFTKIKGGKGSHEKWYSEDSHITLTVPHNLKSRHTANDILKTAGAKERL